jgi:hypothetical protein
MSAKNDAFEAWAKFLHPACLKANLIGASLFLAAYETLKSTAIERARDFYWNGFDEQGADRSNPEYVTSVLSRHKSPFQASLLWFVEMRAIDEAELACVERLREQRNDIAHSLPEFVAGRRELNFELFRDICELVCKIDRWWIREIELPMNPDFDDQDITAIPNSEITSGRMMFLSLLLRVATADEEEANNFYDSVFNAVGADPN